MNSTRCQVLVVGAGPTGMVLAAELLARGVSTRLIDKNDGAVLESRANGVHARTLEVLDMMGIADELVERGHKVDRFRWYSNGRSLGALNMSLNPSRFGFLLCIPQHDTERLLRSHVAQLGGSVEQCAELLSLTCSEDCVFADVRRADGSVEQIEADYVVGCDGAHSRVRHELGLSFDGHAYGEDWLLADVHLNWTRSEDEVHALFHSDGLPMICFPLREHVWRIVLPYTGVRGRQPPTSEEMQELVDHRSPERVVLSDPAWLANFRCQRRSTNVYRQGRVLLAGDAVHVHSPAGGQGMNTGIMDAHNLGWKLALAISGRSPDWLLDTYAEERGPVAAQVLELTHNLVRVGTVRHRWQRVLRDLLVPIASSMTPLQRRAVRRLTQEHVSYKGTRLSMGGASAGSRAPDVEVISAGGQRMRLYELLREARHVLVVPLAADVSKLDSDYRFGDVSIARAAVRGLGSREACLVRPDGYIAACGLNAVREYLQRVLVSPSVAPGREPLAMGTHLVPDVSYRRQ
jgi:2-polyprenyl-6-methoxyphenol hydroxylase-like FAD-dependent oxidoreductase